MFSLRNGVRFGGRVVEVPTLGAIHCAAGGRWDVPFLYDEIFRSRAYVRHGIELKAGDTVFDVGANVGLFTLFAHRECHGNVTIFAFEPIPLTFEMLKSNVKRHVLTTEAVVKLFGQGLTALDEPNEVEFVYYRHEPANSTYTVIEKEEQIRELTLPSNFMAFARSRVIPLYVLLSLARPVRRLIIRQLIAWAYRPTRVTCPMTTLSNVIERHNVATIDLLKIDVEGAELDVLRGLQDEHWERIRQVSMEVHDWGGKLKHSELLLRQKGFRVTYDRRQAFKQAGVRNYDLYAVRG